MPHVRRAGVNQLARDAEGAEVLLEFHAEVGGVRRNLRGLAEGGGGGVAQVDRRVVARGVFPRRIFFDPRQQLGARGEECRELGVARREVLDRKSVV